MKVSLKSKLEDASRESKKMNIKICDFFHGAASPAATHKSGRKFMLSKILNFKSIHIKSMHQEH